MLFSSIPFLYWFLPCVLIFYFAAPRRLKNTALLLSSLFFYGWGEPGYVVWMAAAIVMGYVFGLLIERFRGNHKISKLMLVLSVSGSLAILGYFKYADFFIGNFNAATGLFVPLLHVTLPIGISFYTFQILSYTVDVYRGKVAAQKNFIDLAAYVALFPQLIAGPIVRYSNVAGQLKGRTHSVEKAALGIRRFAIGLSKKVLLANLLGGLCSVFHESDDKILLRRNLPTVNVNGIAEYLKGDCAMKNKITEPILGKTANAGNPSKGAELGKVKERTAGEHTDMEIMRKRTYSAISKNGDTLELSEAGRSLEAQTETESPHLSGKSSVGGSSKKIPDVVLAGYSEVKLKQLYASKKITKQQYERILKKIK